LGIFEYLPFDSNIYKNQVKYYINSASIKQSRKTEYYLNLKTLSFNPMN